MELLGAGLLKTLRRAVNDGRFPLSCLDEPSAGWKTNLKTDRRTFPHGYQGIQHRNLLRDDPSIEASPSPRDLAPAQEQQPSRPIF
jgi:hypothetical protein